MSRRFYWTDEKGGNKWLYVAPTLIIAFCFLLLLATWTDYYKKAEREQIIETDSAVKQTTNLARVFEEYTYRAVSNVDRMVSLTKEEYEVAGTVGRLGEYIREGKGTAPLFNLLSIWDKNGDLVLSSPKVYKVADSRKRASFMFHRSNPQSQLFIGKIVFGKASGTWYIPISRRINNKDGSFGGMVLASVNPDYFTELYKKVNLGQKGELTLVHSNGDVLTGWTAGNEIPFNENKRNEVLLEKINKRSSGSYLAVSSIDGVKRITSYARIKDFPLIVSVGMAETDFLKGFYIRKDGYYHTAVYFSLFIIAGTVMLLYLFYVQQKKEQLLQYFSNQDALTGVHNRVCFEAILKSNSINGKLPSSIILCDVDELKVINDTHGHAVGDKILKQTGEILNKTFGQVGYVVRIGGDEFAIILMDVSEDGVKKHISMMSDLVDEYNQSNRSVRLSVSVGYAIRRTQDEQILNLYKEADNSMYREKFHHGRDMDS